VYEYTIIKVAGGRKQPGVSGMQHIGAGRVWEEQRGDVVYDDGESFVLLDLKMTSGRPLG
jgi:hypothetical protein